MSNRYSLKSYNKFKRLRNKDSYMSAFLERRKKAADFALTDKNKIEYDYKKPYYISKNEEEILELKKKNENQMNSVRNKSEFYKTYNTLKNNLTNKNKKNSNANKIIIEKKNNKYYLSQEKKLENKKEKNFYIQNPDKFEYNIDLNKKYNNIKHHTIKVSSKPKKSSDKNNSKRNHSWKDLQIQKTTSLNNYDCSENNSKNENEIDSSPHPYLVMSNEYEYYISSKKNNEYNPKEKINNNKNENDDINELLEKYKSKNIYHELTNKYKYHESSPKNKNETDTQNKEPENYYPKNYSEPQNIFEKTKNIYSFKETKVNNNVRNNINTNNNNNYNFDYKSKINEISPIKTHYHNEFKDFNENAKNLEKIYESQTLNLNGYSKSDTNIKLRNNSKLENNQKNNYNNNIQYKNSNQDLNMGYYKEEKSSNLYNYQNELDKDSQKLKNVGILYKNKKYYIDDNSNNLEIPLIIDKDSNRIVPNINIINEETKNIQENNDKNNYINMKLKEEDINILMKNEKENDIQKLNESNKSTKNKEQKIILDKGIYFSENKSQQNNNSNNFDDNKLKENNNNKIKNIKSQCYKKLSEGNNYNFDSIKEKYESFLKPKEEKEPNIQSKVINSLLSSKEDLNNNNNNNIHNNNNIPTNNNIGNHNKSLVKSIQEKIKILKNNKNQNRNRNEYNNYINEIDECYSKFKLKEEKDNLALEQYYTDLIQKENDIEKKDTLIKKEKYKEKDINKEVIQENIKTNDNKKKIIQKSKRLEYIMRNLLNNKKYNYFDYHYLSNKINKTKSKNKENIDINCMKYLGSSAPDINLIVDESIEDNIKLIDENDFTKFKKNNLRSARTNSTSKNDKNNKNNSFRNLTNKRSSENLANYHNYVSPRLIIKNISHKIMPPNEL